MLDAKAESSTSEKQREYPSTFGVLGMSAQVCTGISRLGQEVTESHSAPAIIDTGTTLIITSYSIVQDYGDVPRATAHTEGEDTYWTSVAATVVSSMLAIAQLQLPINVVALTPLCENLLGPKATKPGDVIYAMNGKSVEVDNTDAEGRLVLAGAHSCYPLTSWSVLTFSKMRSIMHQPNSSHTVIDVATLTGYGAVYTGVFTNSDALWNRLSVAGESEYDRFWRMLLDEDYGPQIYSSNADLCNTGGKPTGSCTAALFLKAFVDGIEARMDRKSLSDGLTLIFLGLWR
ncbi:Zn-dependent exopeptidase [Suillus brevipes Sb2]|nr:Zn-dependent exopeptidase [Suillus brevipes Sb2]